MEVSAKMVNELRGRTGAGMMDCKSALKEASGDMEEAAKILRKKGLAAAAKKAGRVASEGLVAVKIETEAAAMVEVNCETDFVARTAEFRELVEVILDRVLHTAELGETEGDDGAGLAALPSPERPGERISDLVAHQIAKIGENISIRRFARLVPKEREEFSAYVHGNGRIGVIVGSRGGDGALRKDVAMHVAASEPRFVRREQVTDAILAEEQDIAREQARSSGKPEAVIERMIQGKLEKFYQETVLFEQAFVKDPARTVGHVVVERGGEEALDLRFVRFKLGEGLARGGSPSGG
jgi:elongation factor Ts